MVVRASAMGETRVQRSPEHAMQGEFDAVNALLTVILLRALTHAWEPCAPSRIDKKYINLYGPDNTGFDGSLRYSLLDASLQVVECLNGLYNNSWWPAEKIQRILMEAAITSVYNRVSVFSHHYLSLSSRLVHMWRKDFALINRQIQMFRMRLPFLLLNMATYQSNACAT
ncbi:hypothetical protein KIN20_010579 [Parelaphostrongylus tenuis]|uniref:Uncharacterized protein n=1 Tax=Parelaphostrongylus tenuis TaxID=148309 RepID=A0AAD5MZ66_PARTN|nr:hypothetical protein KIN20_010579 [Parelaphostrongylus tenuis]